MPSLDTLLSVVTYALIAQVVTPLFPFLYIVLRWRTGSQEGRGIGTYAAILYFATVAVLLTVAGGANLLYGWMSTTPLDPLLDRLSWGMFTASLIFLAAQVPLARVVAPDGDTAPARRVFGGFLLVIAGMVGFGALIMFFVTIFHDVEGEKATELRADELKLWGSWFVCFLALYGCAATRMARRG